MATIQFALEENKKMNARKVTAFVICFLTLAAILPACNFSTLQPTATAIPTDTQSLTATATLNPTYTPRITLTTRPSLTPDIMATQHITELDTEIQKYFDLGYLSTNNGRHVEYDDFEDEWAQLDWYRRWNLKERARNFYISAHFKWSSAYRNADISGCGFAFSIQNNEDHYSVFLDRSRVFFVETEYYYEPIGPTRGTGRVSFDNPFDSPVEADFTLIVNKAYAYVLVNDELVGEYTLSESKAVRGNLGLTLLSGTNKDFGTRCEMTNLHIWIPQGE